jgi:thiosulfate sulfurtransferase
MKRGILLSMLPLMVFAKIQTVEVSPDVVKQYDQIVDVRTLAEWEDTGVIDGAKTITFDPNDKQNFFNELSKQVDLKKPVALICRSGRRSMAAANAIDNGELNIINLDGGMMHLINQGYKTIPYKK